jgi:hypothetical protein
MTWKANPTILKWNLKWKALDDPYFAMDCSIFLKEVMFSRHKNVMNIMEKSNDKDIMICLLLLGKTMSNG